MATYTPEERIAIRYCELLGLDPFKDVMHGPEPQNGIVHDVLLYSPCYMLYVKEIKQHLALVQAVTETQVAVAAERHEELKQKAADQVPVA